MPTCFFIGHRDAPDSLLAQLSTEVERHITEYQATDFVVGSYGRFDSLAARAVKSLLYKALPEKLVILAECN